MSPETGKDEEGQKEGAGKLGGDERLEKQTRRGHVRSDLREGLERMKDAVRHLRR